MQEERIQRLENKVDFVAQEVSGLRVEISGLMGEIRPLLNFSDSNGVSRIAVIEHRVGDLESQFEQKRELNLATIGARMQNMNAKHVALWTFIGGVALFIVNIFAGIVLKQFGG